MLLGKKIDIDVVLIPTGSYEQQGPFLPLDTDTVLAREIANLVRLKFGERALLLPEIPYGYAFEHSNFWGTVSVDDQATYLAYVRLVLASISRNFAPKIIAIVNGHGGNRSLIEAIATDFNYRNDTKSVLLHLMSDYNHDKAVEIFGTSDTHGGTVTASLYHYLTKSGPPNASSIPGSKKKVSRSLTLFRTDELSSSGVISDTDEYVPDVEKGRMLADFIVDGYVQKIKKLMQDIEVAKNVASAN